MPQPPNRVNTKKAPRRSLKLSSLDAILSEADVLAKAEAEGRLRASGNWTLGQAIGHLAVWISYNFDGLPPGAKAPPAPVRLMMRLVRGFVLNGKMPPGVNLPGVKGGTYATEVMETGRALALLRASIARLKASAPTNPNPLFGKLRHDEWKSLHMRHAELHLGFFEAA